MKRVATLLLCGFTMTLASLASAATFSVTLTGPGESPPNASPGTGTAVVSLDTVAHRLSVSVSFSGLTTPTTMSHIHCCVAPPGTAGVATTTPSFVGFPLGVTSGTFTTTLDTTQASSWNPAYITANGGTPLTAETALAAGMNAGQAYLNIHTTAFPAGEIRGFLSQLPIPTLSNWSLVLVAAFVAIAGFIAMRRRAG